MTHIYIKPSSDQCSLPHAKRPPPGGYVQTRISSVPDEMPTSRYLRACPILDYFRFATRGESLLPLSAAYPCCSPPWTAAE